MYLLPWYQFMESISGDEGSFSSRVASKCSYVRYLISLASISISNNVVFDTMCFCLIIYEYCLVVYVQVAVAIFIAVKFGVDGNPGELPKWYAIVVVLFICVYVAGFAWSWGPLGWLVPSEIFPLEIRSAAQSINVSVNMVFTFAIAQVFLTMLCHLKFGLFLFFGFWVIIMTIFIFFFLPETKNIPIEEMVIVWKQHWFWSKFMTDVNYPNGSIELENGNGAFKKV